MGMGVSFWGMGDRTQWHKASARPRSWFLMVYGPRANSKAASLNPAPCCPGNDHPGAVIRVSVSTSCHRMPVMITLQEKKLDLGSWCQSMVTGLHGFGPW
jgi:hypothetical protein